MGDLASFLPGFTPIGGIIPVSSGANIAGTTNFKMADGSDILSASYPTIAAQLPPAIQTGMSTIPGDNVAMGNVAFGNGVYVAIQPLNVTSNSQYFATVWISTDGVTWLPKRLNGLGMEAISSFSFTSIAFLNNKFYLGGTNTSSMNYIWSSNSGQDWQLAYSDTTAAFTSYNDGINTYTSWTKITSLAYVNGTYVATLATQTGSNNGPITRMYTSTNGVTWSINSTLPNGYGMSIAYGAGVYVLVCNDGTTYSSTNLTTWTARTNSGTGSAGWNYVTFGNGAFVSVQGFSTSGTSVGYSTDGITWSQKAVTSSRYFKVIYANSLFVTVGINICLTSPNGITWTSRTVPNSTWNDVAYGASGGFVAVQSTSGNVALNSSAGTTWNSVPLNAGGTSFMDVCYGTALGYMAVTSTGIPSISTDGQTWTQKTTLTSLNSVACTPSGSIYVGYSTGGGGTLYSTTDGVTWTSRFATNGTALRVRWCNDKFIAISYYSSQPVGNRVYWSYDGIKWNWADSGTVNSDGVNTNYGIVAQDVTYGNGMYVGVGYGHTAIYPPTSAETNGSLWSTDGVVWYPAQNMPTRAIWTGVAYGNGVFVAVAKRHRNVIGTGYSQVYNANYANFIGPSYYADTTGRYGREAAVSTNGIDWVTTLMPFAAEWTSITFNGHVFIAIANCSGSYAVSKDGYNWTMRTLPASQMLLGPICTGASNTSVAVPIGVNIVPNTNAAAVKFTESATQVTLPYIRPSEGVNYAVKVL